MSYELLVITTLLAIAIPDALAIFAYSASGLGPELANVVATEIPAEFAILSVVLAGLFAVLCFVLDIPSAPTPVQTLFGFLVVMLILGAATLNLIVVPASALLICLELTFLILAFLRCKLFDAIPFRDFFTAGAISFGICTGVTSVGWVVWRFSMGPIAQPETQLQLASRYLGVYELLSRDLHFNLPYSACVDLSSLGLSEEDQASASRVCSAASAVWYAQWVAPVAVPAINAVSALCFAVFVRFDASSPRTRAPPSEIAGLTADERQAVRAMSATLKRFFLILACALAAIYATSSMLIARISIIRSLIYYTAAGTLTLLGFVFLETDRALLWKVLSHSQFYRATLQVAKNDWIRAFFLSSVSILVPISLGLDMMRQQVRRWTAPGRTQAGRFTSAGRYLIDELHTWDWTSVLRKFNLICSLFILLLVGMRVTYVFFSWLNVELIAWNLDNYSITALVFAIGLGMFMLPIVPGTAVYIFAGVVLGYQAQSSNRQLWHAIGVGVSLSSVAKMLACIGQYLIGYLAGRSVRVQRFVAVDRVFTRAMEKILNCRGMSPGKVCILVAGPDFPTSVLCGILKLNIPQMLLGTTPVILVSIVPQVCVGALLTTSPTSSARASTPELTQAVTACAAIIQAAATLYVSYRIMRTAEDHYQELSQHRPEHDRVAELTKKEEAYTRKYAEITRWEDMHWMLRASILLSSGIFLLVSWVLGADFTLSNQMCFRTFSITDRIDADFESGGLAGNVLNLVSHPVGTVTLILSGVAFVMHIALGHWLDLTTRRSLTAKVASEPSRPQCAFHDVLGRPMSHELS